MIKLIEAVEDLKRELDIPPTIREILGAEPGKEQEFMARLDT